MTRRFRFAVLAIALLVAPLTPRSSFALRDSGHRAVGFLDTPKTACSKGRFFHIYSLMENGDGREQGVCAEKDAT